MTSSLFISYASDDQAVATEICALLEAQGICCWIAPRDVAPGAKWDEALLRAIDDAGAFLLLLSRASNDSPFVQNEVNRAFGKKKAIFTFRIEDVPPAGSLEFYLARHHWTDGFAAPPAETVPQLAAGVAALLGTTAGAPSPMAASGVAVADRVRKVLPARRVGSPAASWRLGLVVAGVALASATAGWWFARPATSAVLHLAIPIDPSLPLGTSNDPTIVISPDGSRLVYVSRGPLIVRDLRAAKAVAIPGTEQAHSPFFSPDGQWVGFFSHEGGNTLRKVPLSGGPAEVVATVPSPHLGATWVSDGSIVFAGPGLSRVSADGGTPVSLTTPDQSAGELRHAFPDALPDGRGLLFATLLEGTSRIEALRLDTGERHVVVQEGTAARYVPTGHIVYSQGGRLMGARFDLDALGVIGTPSPLLDGVAVTADGPAAFSVSSDGSLVYLPTQDSTLSRGLAWVDMDGAETPIAMDRYYRNIALSPDGTRVSGEFDSSGNTDIWVYDIGKNTHSRITFEPGPETNPLWTRDGRRLAFRSGRGLVWKPADGTGVAEPLRTGLDGLAIPADWAPDGRTLIYTDVTRGDVFQVETGSGASARPLLQSPFQETHPRTSPDGRWIAFASNETGGSEVYVRPFPDVQRGRWQVSTSGGFSPLWSRDGRWLYYRTAPSSVAGEVVAVPVSASEIFAAGPPRTLFERWFPGLSVNDWALAPDGRRFLTYAADMGSTGASAYVVLIQHWFEDLERLVGE